MDKIDEIIERLEKLEYDLHPEWFIKLYTYASTCENCGKSIN